MLDGFGAALRTMREAAGLTLAALARHAAVSKPHLGHLETGDRQPTMEVAEALDRALRAGGVLVELAATERGGGDTMRRRALLTTVGAAATVGTIGGPHALSDMVRHGLLAAADAAEDWEQVAEDCQRRLVTDPSPMFGAALLTNLERIRQQLGERPQPGLLSVAARIGQVYGLWLGNQAELGGANHWYRSSATLADRSGDVRTLAWVLGRSASRGVYEDWTVAQTLDAAGRALALSERPSPGRLEAYAALAHVYALTGDVRAGREACRSLFEVAEVLPGAGHVERALFLRAFFEARVGGWGAASAACDEAERSLAALPTWLLETRVYRARAMVAAGDTQGGLAYALDTVRGLRHEVRVIGVAVRDVCCAVPDGYRSTVLNELWGYASPTPGPWEVLR
ncbi:helix-turn-helix transcriptional regulator [Micromonospora tulbaghiae]|uniref:helix-turn-helix domain-containing protein n=1 Tax=Micromonospora tulbaghiae TaxID=479978 RepID=UPI0033B6C8F0